MSELRVADLNSRFGMADVCRVFSRSLRETSDAELVNAALVAVRA